MDAKWGISHEVVVAAGPFAPGHLGELTQLVPFEMVDEVLAESGRTQQRIPDLPSRVAVYPLLAGSLFPGIGWKQVRQRLTAWPGRTGDSDSDGLAHWRRPAGGSGPGCCVACSTCCAGRPRGSAPWERGGGACSSARSTAR